MKYYIKICPSCGRFCKHQVWCREPQDEQIVWEHKDEIDFLLQYCPACTALLAIPVEQLHTA